MLTDVDVATMELYKVLANILRRYHFERVEDNSVPTELREGFLVKPTKLLVRMSMRS